MLTVHAIATRFGSSPTPAVPVPRVNRLPIFSDNVIPSLLIHLGVIDLSTSSSGLASLFLEAGKDETLNALLAPAPDVPKDAPKAKAIPREGPLLTAEQAFTLRAAAIDACELIVATARTLRDDELASAGSTDFSWLREITPPEIDAWLWSIAKDRADYRALTRFAERGTVYF